MSHGPSLTRRPAIIAWDAADPPDAAELARNELIFTTYQHNRNPFIDHPEYAAAILGTGPGSTLVAQATNGVETAIESPFVAGSFIVRLSPAPSGGAATVNFAMSGTAAFSDYTLSGSGVAWNSGTGTGTITFQNGTSAVTVTLAPTSDALAEPVETALLALASGSEYSAVCG